jgi:S-formylglutathione hydrolase
MVEVLSSWRSHEGQQLVVRHQSRATGTDMTFSIFLPPQASEGRPLPVIWYLSGLTCTHANVTEKGEYRAACAALGIAFVAPDTSPRGDGVADSEDYDLGQGAGFYVDAIREPFAPNYAMATYILEELPKVVAEAFPVDLSRQSIMGHSMGGHGALVLSLRNPGRFHSVSAFAPIVAPSQVPWGQKVLRAYLGDEGTWGEWDAVSLIERGSRSAPLLVDQGMADSFLETQLRPELLEKACASAGIPLELRRREGYDHSYYFISTFMADHVSWHAAALRAGNQ